MNEKQEDRGHMYSLSRAAVCLPSLLVFAGCSPGETGGPGVELASSLLVEGEAFPGGETTNTLLFGENALARHVENITPESELMFFSGNGFFNQPWVTAPASTEARDGLGPLFNARSCSGCHFKDGRGRPPIDGEDELLSILFRLSVGQDDNEMPLGDALYGGQLQPFATGNVPAEGDVSILYEERPGEYPDGTEYSLRVPSYMLTDLAYGAAPDGVTLSPRVAPAMHGLGLLEAITEERLYELADEEDDDGDGVSGRVRLVPQAGGEALAIGRFGWKAEQPTIRQQSAGAFLGDMGLTTPMFPDGVCEPGQSLCEEQPSGALPGETEISVEILDRIERYGQLVAVPARSRFDDEEILEGKRVFLDSGCGDCHTPRHVTGAHELAELGFQVIFPYTDLLVHDMGDELADGGGETRVDREWRTPPLWSLRFYPVVNDHDLLLHDGRARGVEEAILWHGGEGEASRDAFMHLSAEERDLVIRFVESL